ncbi:MAG: DUF4373 domain-containing protein [Cyanobacteriota bacterium]|nr:DUF4373 domain-containing protein [Cyanobacteriota bacterium]MDY6364355.1 DUF4373 domain-containing protein [Cyanobacteriota bacterium]
MAKIYQNTYFQHDMNARRDPKIKKLLTHFRKIDENTAKAAVCIFWWIIEDMHSDDYRCDNLEVFADDYRCDVDFLKSILEDFGLFRKENGCYVSDRVLRNLAEQEEKAKGKKSAANVRWLLAAFNKAYTEFFDEPPVLEPEEIENLKKYNDKIPDLKAKLRDILYTLSLLKFDNDINFKPCANWLLKDNNLARLVNGEFGKLKHKKTARELKLEHQKQERERETEQAPTEFELQLEQISGKAQALDFIADYYSDKQLVSNNSKLFLLPELKELAQKFDITNREIKDRCGE